jgi:uncharacterized protein
MTAAEVIERLGLQPHPEGGFFRETYRAGESIPADALPDRYGASRAFGTAIHFLLTAENFSAFHRVQSDEIFHFHLGDPAVLTEMDEAGRLTETVLGPGLAGGHVLQRVVRRGAWQALRVADGGAWTLLGATVAPGFDFADFQMADPADLAARFPAHRRVIEALARHDRA